MLHAARQPVAAGALPGLRGKALPSTAAIIWFIRSRRERR
jgi:hypothetical protein